MVPPGIEPRTQGQEFRASSPLLYQYKSAYVKQKDFLVNEEVFSVVPPGIEPGTQGQEFRASSPLLYQYKSAYVKQKDFLVTKKSFLWCHQESNRGHKDFQSFALPTELWHQVAFSSASAVCCRCGLFASAKVRRLLLLCKKMRKLFGFFMPYGVFCSTALCNYS